MSSSYLTVSAGTISMKTVTRRGASGPIATPCHGCDLNNRSSAGGLDIRHDYIAGLRQPRGSASERMGGMTSAAGRRVHVLAASAGVESVEELVPALHAAGSLVSEHVLAPAALAATEDPERLRAELALVAAAVRAAEADGGTLLLADERGALAVPERMRMLLDEQQLGWDEAWARTGASLVARFAVPRSEPSRPFWTVAFLETEQPRLLEILFEINRRHLDAVEAAWPGDVGRRRRLSLFRESAPAAAAPRPARPRRVRSQLSSRRPGKARPARSSPTSRCCAARPSTRGRTAVFARRFVVDANPPLAELLSETLVGSWASDAWRFEELETLAFDAPFRAAFRAARRANRERLGAPAALGRRRRARSRLARGRAARRLRRRTSGRC